MKRNSILNNKKGWFIAVFMIVWINSLIGTTDINNWFIENTLTVIALLFLIITYKKYRFSNFSYFLICIFLCLHVYGSKYTYADNLFGYWLQAKLDTTRNQYDRIVHFSFGLLLYYPLQELLSKWIKLPKYLALKLPVLIIISASSLYEIIEWLVADKFFVAEGASYLGLQGDVWDSQKDMAVAFLGAVLAAIAMHFYVFSKKEHNSSEKIIQY